MSYPNPVLSKAGAGTDVDRPYVNRNKNYQFAVPIATGIGQLSSFKCSEATVVNKSGQSLSIFDGSQSETWPLDYTGYNTLSTSSRAFLLDDNDSFTFKGLTDSSQLSASVGSSSGTIYVRTSYFSNSISL
tara:strand:+ start:709 stop:1101 length:393 start_codon:yes stop_codon:yes gene_type:complete